MLKQFEVFVKADAYAPREVFWLSSAGSVLRTVSSEYTVRLERGIALGGQVLDDAGVPLAGVTVGVQGNNYRGYTESLDANGKVISPPEVRAEDFASFACSTAAERGTFTSFNS